MVPLAVVVAAFASVATVGEWQRQLTDAGRAGTVIISTFGVLIEPTGLTRDNRVLDLEKVSRVVESVLATRSIPCGRSSCGRCKHARCGPFRWLVPATSSGSVHQPGSVPQLRRLAVQIKAKLGERKGTASAARAVGRALSARELGRESDAGHRPLIATVHYALFAAWRNGRRAHLSSGWPWRP